MYESIHNLQLTSSFIEDTKYNRCKTEIAIATLKSKT